MTAAIHRTFAGLFLLSTLSCNSVEPGIFIVVRSNITDLARVRLQLTRDGAPAQNGRTYFDTIMPVRRAAPDIVGSIAVRAPTDRSDVALYVTATALVGDREVLTQRALVTFDARRQQRLTMFLAAECESFRCRDGDTCTRGPSCVSETIERLPNTRDDAAVNEPLYPSPRPSIDAGSVDDARAFDAQASDSNSDARPTDATAADRTNIDAATDATRADAAMDADAATDAARADAATDAPVVRSLSVIVGGTHNCGSRDGVTYCWGSRSHGQTSAAVLANDTVGPVPLPFPVFRLGLGARHTCALFVGMENPFCWGDAALGALGRPGVPGGSLPAQVSATLSGLVELWSAGAMTCVASVGPTFRCWGDNRFGQLGIAGRTMIDAPTLTFTTGPADLSIPAILGAQTVCFRHGRSPWFSCAGLNDRGQFGGTTPAESATLIPVTGANMFGSQATAGGAHACVIPTPIGGSRVQCWGDNGSLQCGRGASDDAGPPVMTSFGPIDDSRTSWTAVSAGRSATCAIDGSNAYCWGSNEFGQLGTGSMTPTRTAAPQRVMLPDAVVSIDLSPDSDVACATTRSMQLYCWGDNRWGQLGYAPRTVGSPEATPTPALLPL